MSNLNELINKRKELFEIHNQILRNESIPLGIRLTYLNEIMKQINNLSTEILLEKKLNKTPKEKPPTKEIKEKPQTKISNEEKKNRKRKRIKEKRRTTERNS
ncbi:MAG: hypothetical protein NZZ41_06660 [Candidatus Dojkabacteria bacterium]|nr:hypothetical protein [Candidatus Dojkabacteria bacterium]